MANKKKGHRAGVYPVKRKYGEVFYGDFRDLGFKCQRLVDERGNPVSDRITAQRLYAEQRTLLEKQRSSVASRGGDKLDGRFGPFITYHLTVKSDAGAAVTTLTRDEGCLRRFFQEFGNVRMQSISSLGIERYVANRLREPGLRGATVSPHTVNNELNALSNLLEHAKSHGLVSENVVRLLRHRPKRPDDEARFLELEESSRLLDAAAEIDAEVRVALLAKALKDRAVALGDGRASSEAKELRQQRRGLLLRAGLAVIHKIYEPIHEPLSATFLYTSARHEEATGLAVEDLDFEHLLVHFRSNEFRALKRSWHKRSVPMWEPYAHIMRAYLAEAGITSGLVFPTLNEAGATVMRASVAGQIERVVQRARLADPDSVTPHTMRHTYAAMMLQTFIINHEGKRAQRSTFEVKNLLGHKHPRLVDLIYGHIMKKPRYMDFLTYEEFRQFPASRLEIGVPFLPPIPNADQVGD